MRAIERFRHCVTLLVACALLWGCSSILQPRQAISFVVQNKSSQWLDQVVVDLDDDARLRHLASVRPGDYNVEVGFNRVPSRAVITWTQRGGIRRSVTVPVGREIKSGERLWSVVFEIRDQEMTVLVGTNSVDINKGSRVIYTNKQ